MLPKHDFESAISDDAAAMKGLFWNPVEVADVAWRELFNKLSAVAAIEAAVADEDEDAILVEDDDDDEAAPLKKRKTATAAAAAAADDDDDDDDDDK
jgi:hypothetical protein